MNFDFVDAYAKLEHKATLLLSQGKQVPPQIQQAMLNIENLVKTRLDPQQIQAAVHAKDVALLNLRQQHNWNSQEQQERNGRAGYEKAVANVTMGILGQDKLTPEQLQAIVDKKPFRARIPQRVPSQSDRDHAFREQTKGIDPKGKGWDEKENERRMDELADANPQQFERLARNYRADPTQLRAAARRWKADRVDYGLERRVAERMPKKDDNPVITEVDDRERRRAIIAHSYLNDVADHASEGDWAVRDLGEQIPDDLMERKDRAGDIARAYAEVESRGDSDG